MTTITITDVIAQARERYQGQTDAEFDYHLAAGQESALLALDSALYELANRDRVEPSRPWGDEEHDARTAASMELRRQLTADLDEYVAGCRARKYTGWSDWSSGPVRYADEVEG